MAMREDFCAFILSHGRPDRVHTYKTLMRGGYTGKVYIVIDDEDKTADQYRERYGDKVLQFCKQEYAEKLDEGDNSGKRISTIYARAAMFDLAPQVGCKYFIQLDDDYTHIGTRFGPGGIVYTTYEIRNLDCVFEIVLEFFLSTQFLSIAFAQGGDFIGGPADCGIVLKRKAMNSFFCSIDRPWVMTGRMNEDVSTYVLRSLRGDLFGTITQVYLVQLPTQKNAGGMSALYVDSGTYIKTFYTIMYAPACVKVSTIGDPGKHGATSAHYRIHHKINWHVTAPKIIREDWKKDN